ncbi:MAG: ATP-binding protein [Psychrobium sp.]|nr:ATP-binding protein [Psychrobium sp.]
MILRYGATNFYCFKESFEIDLRLNGNCPDEISNGNNYSKVMCVKGANGAGKTNALKVLPFIGQFITSSFSHKPNAPMEMSTYFNNEGASKFFCEFQIDDCVYRYDLIVKSHEVLEEKLCFIHELNKPLFHRVGTHDLIIHPDFSELLAIPHVRSNASVISTAHQHEMSCLTEFYAMFSMIVSNVSSYGFDELSSENSITEFYHHRPHFLEFVKETLIKFDIGIVDIKIDSYEDGDGKLVYFPLFYFKIDEELKPLRLHHQSSGTKRLYRMLGYFFIVIHGAEKFPYGSILVMDELDLHLHTDIVPELVNLFEKATNVQLIFNCQNDYVMDLMGKYRMTIINKTDNESYSYRLDELPSDLLRNNRPITPHYRKGSIGGVPNIVK